MADKEAAYDTSGLLPLLLTAGNFLCSGRVKKRRGGAGVAAAARGKLVFSVDRGMWRNSEDPPAS